MIPVGAKAYGEVTRVKSNGAAGKAGSVGAKLLWVELGEDRIPITGEGESKGRKEGGGVVMASAIWGPFGLLMKGGAGKLKAGHIFNGYIPADLLYDPATGRFVAPGGQGGGGGRAMSGRRALLAAVLLAVAAGARRPARARPARRPGASHGDSGADADAPPLELEAGPAGPALRPRGQRGGTGRRDAGHPEEARAASARSAGSWKRA